MARDISGRDKRKRNNRARNRTLFYNRATINNLVRAGSFSKEEATEVVETHLQHKHHTERFKNSPHG